MPRKPQKSELECLICENFNDDEFIGPSHNFSMKTKNYSINSTKTRTLLQYNSKNNPLKPNKEGTASDYAYDHFCTEDIGLVSNSKKPEVFQGVYSVCAIKKLSSGLDGAKMHLQNDIIRVYETQMFVESKGRKGPGTSDGLDLLEEKRLFSSRKSGIIIETDKNGRSLSYKRMHKNKDKDVKSKSQTKSVRIKFKKFIRRNGNKAWKGLKHGWGAFQSSLNYLAGPFMTFDISHETLNAWKFRGSEA